MNGVLEVKFGRKAAQTPASDEAVGTPEPFDPTSGPFDVSQLPADDTEERADLGALRIPKLAGKELRVQVEEASGRVQAVVLVGQDGALEFQAFAAPRNGDLWSTVRPQIAADLQARGGTATEREGRWGTELVCQVPVQRADGSKGTQPSRIIGVNGERWLLRASLLGRPALDPENSQEWEDALSRIVVDRGGEAMPVGEPLTVTLPDSARRMG